MSIKAKADFLPYQVKTFCMKIFLLGLLLLPMVSLRGYGQNTGIGTLTPMSRLNVNGTSWFQGDNTPLPGSANSGVAIGFSPGASGGYIFAFNYANFTPRDLWLNSPGGRVLINSASASPQGRLDVTGAGIRAIYASTSGGEALYGYSSGGHGIWGRSATNLGVYALSDAAGGAGIIGEGKYIGVQGNATGSDGNRQAVRGELAANTGGYAGIFVNGTTGVFGTLTKTAGAFLIDHPLEPSTKFLYHSFVESPDMKNIYDGVTTTGSDGLSTITMPDWFSALNMDFSYQLTVIGQFAQAIILQEINANKFVIKTDKPGVKVSWQITGTRHDPYAMDRRIPVEKLKAPNEVGKYIYPQGYGKTIDDLLDILKPTRLTNTAAPGEAKN
jgi:hypothetical protein